MKRIRCSSLPRLATCAGSLKATENLSSPSTEVSESGDRIHLALEAYYRGLFFDDARLTDREHLVFHWFKTEADRLIESHGGAKAVRPEHSFEKEIMTGVILSGHIDLYVDCNDGTDLVIDWKTGQGEVTIAKNNLQIRGYVCGVSGNDREVNAYIFSAGNPEGSRFTSALYSPVLCALAENGIRRICINAFEPSAKRTVDFDACQYCEACATDNCLESIENAQQTAIGLSLIKESSPTLPADRAVVVSVFQAIKTVERFAAPFMKMLKAEVQADPESWADQFELAEGNRKRKVLDVEGVFNSIVNVGEYVDADDFKDALTLSMPAVEKLMKPKLKEQWIKAADQKELIENMLAPFIQITRNAPTVKLKKEMEQ